MDNQLPDPKQLKRLADACRKAGIKQFKGYGMEFTLTDEKPSKTRRSKAPKINHGEQEEIESDHPSEMEMLLWSAGQGIDTEEEPTQ